MASDALVRAQLAAAVEAWLATMIAPVVRLFTNTISPGPDTNFLSLSEPLGDWYTEQAVTYGQVFEHADGSMEVRCTSVQFNYTGADAPETIRGYYVCETGSPFTPYHGNNLPAPVSMGTTLDSVIVNPGLVFSPVVAQA